MKLSRVSSLLLLVAAVLAGCESATLPLAAGTGPRPELPPPHKTLLPTVNIAPAKGWSTGDKPVARSFRLQLQLVSEKGTWLTSDLQFVP